MILNPRVLNVITACQTPADPDFLMVKRAKPLLEKSFLPKAALAPKEVSLAVVVFRIWPIELREIWTCP